MTLNWLSELGRKQWIRILIANVCVIASYSVPDQYHGNSILLKLFFFLKKKKVCLDLPNLVVKLDYMKSIIDIYDNHYFKGETNFDILTMQLISNEY